MKTISDYRRAQNFPNYENNLNFTSTKTSKGFNGREIDQLQPWKVVKKITPWNLIWIFFPVSKKLPSPNKSTCNLCFMMDLRCLSKRGSKKDGSLLNTSYDKLLFYYTSTLCLYVVVVEKIKLSFVIATLFLNNLAMNYEKGLTVLRFFIPLFGEFRQELYICRHAKAFREASKPRGCTPLSGL